MNDPSKPPDKRCCHTCQKPIGKHYLLLAGGKWFCDPVCAWDHIIPAEDGDELQEDGVL